jgi:hypothetical protein
MSSRPSVCHHSSSRCPMRPWLTSPAQDGSDFMGERLTVQFARGSRHREGGFGNHERAAPRPRRTPHRMQITGLPNDTSWQVCLLSPFLSAGFHGPLPLCAFRGALVSMASTCRDCARTLFWDWRLWTASPRPASLAPWLLS